MPLITNTTNIFGIWDIYLVLSNETFAFKNACHSRHLPFLKIFITPVDFCLWRCSLLRHFLLLKFCIALGKFFHQRLFPLLKFSLFQGTFAIRDICHFWNFHHFRRLLPSHNFAIWNMCHMKHLPHETFALWDICHMRHLSFETFAIWDICHSRHFSFKTFST